MKIALAVIIGLAIGCILNREAIGTYIGQRKL